MNTYKWVISSLNAKIEDGELSNVIETVHYRYQATDADGNVADVYGSIGLESPDAESFISHEDLTQADVEAWLEAKLDVAEMQAGLDAQLDAIANPTHVSLNLVAQES
jgi:hypothetical protein